ncbi:MAG: chemotaxis protein CheV [Gammaproteobacteria bacterium]|nr:chemotaxis protein CheV [Gammaproteobacteria bacterium]
MSGLLANVDMRTRLAGHNRLELLLFRLSGKQLFGINVFKVQEVIQCPPLTTVPKSNRIIRGIANMRGKTIPVMDLSMAIGGPPQTQMEGRFVVVTEYNGSTQGFLVNGVDRIVNMNWEEILPPPRGAGRGHYLTAVTRVDEELVEIIDVEKVLAEVIGTRDTVSGELLETVGKDGEADLPLHVLVADDSSVARNQIKRTLDQLGVSCTLARDGREALNQLQAWAEEGEMAVTDRIFMVISDVEMPEMDGYTFTTSVRSDPRFKDLYILLHTSLSGVFNNAMVEKVGANEFIAKFQPDILAGAVLKQMKQWKELRA